MKILQKKISYDTEINQYSFGIPNFSRSILQHACVVNECRLPSPCCLLAVPINVSSGVNPSCLQMSFDSVLTLTLGEEGSSVVSRYPSDVLTLSLSNSQPKDVAIAIAQAGVILLRDSSSICKIDTCGDCSAASKSSTILPFCSMFFCLHSNPIKATSLLNVYEKTTPQRRCKPLSFFEWCFESPENKVSYNENMKDAFSQIVQEASK